MLLAYQNLTVIKLFVVLTLEHWFQYCINGSHMCGTHVSMLFTSCYFKKDKGKRRLPTCAFRFLLLLLIVHDSSEIKS